MKANIINEYALYSQTLFSSVQESEGVDNTLLWEFYFHSMDICRLFYWNQDLGEIAMHSRGLKLEICC